MIDAAGPTHFPNYQYVIGDVDTGHAVVVDPAWDSKGIARRIRREGWSLQAVLLTHGHTDHVNGVAELVGLIPAPVYMSRDEATYYDFDVPGLVHCNDGEALAAGSIEVSVMQTPGHTVGSCCFLVGDNLFAGDTLFPEGVGFTHFEGGSTSDLYDSVRRLSQEIADTTRVYSGHRYQRGLGLTFGELRRLNIYLRLSSRKDFVEFADRRTVAKSHDRLLPQT
ncbi:MBL fold metallo-hydrolase [Micromonospora sp. NPDC050417]|uniref:MBL fold metallo-hydrolase n=1 Tax=Micromonospora sp. NPDC050417 TaxID=3364280 RepID=UPI0037A8D4D2